MNLFLLLAFLLFALYEGKRLESHSNLSVSHVTRRLANSFKRDKAELVTYITAGYPHPHETVDLLLAMEAGGATILELGVPFTDPQADGATIQKANEVALAHKVSLKSCLTMVSQAREKGLKAPVVLMGYYNPFFIYGLDSLMKDARQAGVDGFIVVDLPPEEGVAFVKKAQEQGLSYVPLVSPTTSDERIQLLDKSASSFMYCVSIAGVTGARSSLPSDLKDFIKRIRSNSHAPLAVGFGISTPEQVAEVSSSADGVVIGSAIINTIDNAIQSTPKERSEKLKAFVHSLSDAIVQKKVEKGSSSPAVPQSSTPSTNNFGDYGGRYIPETLIGAHNELEKAYEEGLHDPKLQKELKFIHITKTGGLSIERAGLRIGILWGQYHKEYSPHVGAWHYYFPLKPEELKSKYDWFTVVRNPYTRILSEYYCRWGGIGYQNVTHTRKEMNHYLINEIMNRTKTSPYGGHYSEQYKYIDDGYKINIVKYESLGNDLNILMKRYGIFNITFERENGKEMSQNPILYTTQNFSHKLIKLINEVYHMDFITFGYDKILV